MVFEEKIKRSIKKFFIDAVEIGESVPVTFDKGIDAPPIEGAKEWLVISFGEIFPGQATVYFLYIHVCSIEDPEGADNARLRDLVSSLLMSDTKSLVSIPVHNQAWEPENWLVVDNISESRPEDYEGGQKVKSLTVRFIIMDY